MATSTVMSMQRAASTEHPDSVNLRYLRRVCAQADVVDPTGAPHVLQIELVDARDLPIRVTLCPPRPVEAPIRCIAAAETLSDAVAALAGAFRRNPAWSTLLAAASAPSPSE